MRGIAGALVVAVLLVTVTAGPARAGREERASYATSGDAFTSATTYFAGRTRLECPPPGGIGAGGACFSTGAEDTVAVRIVDASGNPVAGSLYFVGDDGILFADWVHFERRVEVAVPLEAREMVVRVGFWATAGEIVAYFS